MKEADLTLSSPHGALRSALRCFLRSRCPARCLGLAVLLRRRWAASLGAVRGPAPGSAFGLFILFLCSWFVPRCRKLQLCLRCSPCCRGRDGRESWKRPGGSLCGWAHGEVFPCKKCQRRFVAESILPRMPVAAASTNSPAGRPGEGCQESLGAPCTTPQRSLGGSSEIPRGRAGKEGKRKLSAVPRLGMGQHSASRPG